MPDEQIRHTPDFNALELEVLKFWNENKIFEKSLKATEGKPPYIFYDGPPFATGLPHYGHILASTIKDAIPRYQTMRGRFVRRRWVWDCHGLPIENIVEQHLKISGKKQIEEIGVQRFNEVCRENVLKFVAEWGKMVNRMGRWVDFENSSKTMDTSYMESVWWALKQIWDKGLIYEDRKVLLYCSRCETPISNFEVAMDNSYRDITEDSIYSKFKILPKQRIGDFISDDKTFALAWTTTPWTLPGNTALHVGPDIKYVVVEQQGEHYILAKDRLGILQGAYEITSEFSARALEGLEYEPPYPGIVVDPNHKSHHIYIDDFVTTDDGTGVVHSAVMHGEADFLAAKKYGLPQTVMLDHKGQYLDSTPENLRGVFFKDAERIILKDLAQKALSYKVEPYAHSYPHCYRCGTPLYYSALPAWFINIQKIKPDLLRLNESINWYPEHLKHGRFGKSMEQAPDWNISRNRYWATPLPFWKCRNEECKHVVCVGSIDELKERAINFSEVYSNYKSGLSSGQLNDTNVIDLHKPYIDEIKFKCDKCGGEMARIPEVVDCWVESASMPFAELHYPFENAGDSSPEDLKNRFPADFVAEYIGQTRAWFYVMHVMSALLSEQLIGKASPPFKNVVTTGNIRAEDGAKMSKSRRNFPDPWVVIERYGIDSVRFYLLTSPVMNGDDMNFSEKGASEVSKKINMLLWNVLSFYKMYAEINPGTSEGWPGSEALHWRAGSSRAPVEVNRDRPPNVLDRWIMARLLQTQQEVTKQLDGYDTVRAGRAVIDFINDLSTWYLRRSRDRIKGQDDTPGHEASRQEAPGQAARQALATLGYVLAETAKLLAPFMPFLAEHIYKEVTGKESVHLESWSDVSNQKVDAKVLADMELVREAVTIGLAARKELKLPVRQPLRAVAAIAKAKDFAFTPELVQLILDELNIKQFDASLPEKAAIRGQAVKTLPGQQTVASLYLDTELTPELKREGLARELERHIQDLRKKSGLKVGELVDLYYNTQDRELEKILTELVDRSKTFVNKITTNLEVEVDYEAQAEVDGKTVWLGLVKV